MEEKTFRTSCGQIHYWVDRIPGRNPPLVFLPGLTADHRLFEAQIRFFQGAYSLFVWDAPGHGVSRPFRLAFSLADKAAWLHDILQAEGMSNPVLIGQSMGGYVAQAFLQQFPGEAAGFVSVDSCPLQRRYVTAAELWLLKRMEPVYRLCPWNWLLSAGPEGCATSSYGRTLMREMMLAYDENPKEYAALAGHGYRILAEAMEANLPYRIDCPALLLCGEYDQAGSARRYNRAWVRHTGLPLRWIPGAGHNSNTDRPFTVNAHIQAFLRQLNPPPEPAQARQTGSCTNTPASEPAWR